MPGGEEKSTEREILMRMIARLAVQNKSLSDTMVAMAGAIEAQQELMLDQERRIRDHEKRLSAIEARIRAEIPPPGYVYYLN